MKTTIWFSKEWDNGNKEHNYLEWRQGTHICPNFMTHFPQKKISINMELFIHDKSCRHNLMLVYNSCIIILYWPLEGENALKGSKDCVDYHKSCTQSTLKNKILKNNEIF